MGRGGGEGQWRGAVGRGGGEGRWGRAVGRGWSAFLLQGYSFVTSAKIKSTGTTPASSNTIP